MGRGGKGRLRAGALGAALALGAPAAMAASPDAALASPDRREVSASEPEWSTTFETALGYGREPISSRLASDANGIAAGFALLVRWRTLLAGPFVDGTAWGRRDGGWIGGAAGAAFHPAPWARIELLAEGGVHLVSVESPYASEPPGRASLPFLGLRAGAFVFGPDMPRAPQLLWARRAGVGLRVSLRADLRRGTVRIPYPPELGLAPDSFRVGGLAATAMLVLPLEW